MVVRQHPILDHAEQLREVAARLAFSCLDEVWRGWKVRYRFQCSQGHIFHTRPAAFIHAVGCPACAETQRLEHLRMTAAKAGTACLEARWLGARAQHRFRCPKGHRWQRRQARRLMPSLQSIDRGAPNPPYQRLAAPLGEGRAARR